MTTITLDMYQAEYDGAKILAPMSGQVSYVYDLEPGTEMDPYKVLARIADPTALYVNAEYPESITFKKGDKVKLIVGDVEYEGTISYSPTEAREAGDENGNTLYAQFDSEKPAFAYLGSLADIKKVKAYSENAIVIPKHLVKSDGDRQYVQVYSDGEKIEIDVETGITNATEIEIISGLKEGDQVIVK